MRLTTHVTTRPLARLAACTVCAHLCDAQPTSDPCNFPTHIPGERNDRCRLQWPSSFLLPTALPRKSHARPQGTPSRKPAPPRLAKPATRVPQQHRQKPTGCCPRATGCVWARINKSSTSYQTKWTLSAPIRRIARCSQGVGLTPPSTVSDQLTSENGPAQIARAAFAAWLIALTQLGGQRAVWRAITTGPPAQEGAA